MLWLFFIMTFVLEAGLTAENISSLPKLSVRFDTCRPQSFFFLSWRSLYRVDTHNMHRPNN